jgi:hypothetical protein
MVVPGLRLITAHVPEREGTSGVRGSWRAICRPSTSVQGRKPLLEGLAALSLSSVAVARLCRFGRSCAAIDRPKGHKQLALLERRLSCPPAPERLTIPAPVALPRRDISDELTP